MSEPPSVIQAIWTNESKKQWLDSGELHKLHSDERIKKSVGTIVLLINKDREEIFGISKMKSNFADRDLLSIDVYSGDLAKYNRFECIIETKIFTRPISCSRVTEMCEAEDYKQSWYFHLSFRTCFLAGDKVRKEVRDRFYELIYTWI